MFHYSAQQVAWLCLLIVCEGNECSYPTMAWVAETDRGGWWRPGNQAGEVNIIKHLASEDRIRVGELTEVSSQAGVIRGSTKIDKHREMG